ncbi:MAG: nitroreductase [Desulfatitalea sp.]|nr:nitroreductase family protein [Desulfatitalea sp.]NNK00737.1 nitroreductase [Desulfatitalea sp.]
MDDILKPIMERRSIRKYDTRPIPEEALQHLLEAVKWAPSWANTQCWEVIVVKDAAARARLQATVPQKENPAFKAIVQAPVVLALCGKRHVSGYYKDAAVTKFGDWMMFDLGIATQNICLSAHAMGLATVIVGLFDHIKAAEAMQVPEGFELVAMIPVGYPAKRGSAPKRREIGDFTHYDKW